MYVYKVYIIKRIESIASVIVNILAWSWDTRLRVGDCAQARAAPPRKLYKDKSHFIILFLVYYT